MKRIESPEMSRLKSDEDTSPVAVTRPSFDSGPIEDPFNRTATTCCSLPDGLWFTVADESPNNEAVFILNPGTEAAHDAWLNELADIAALQVQLQLALQNPRHFHQAKTLSSTDMSTLCANWRDDQRSAFLSAHSSTIQLKDIETNEMIPG